MYIWNEENHTQPFLFYLIPPPKGLCFSPYIHLITQLMFIMGGVYLTQ